MTFTPLKAVALVVFLGAVAGATYGVQTIVGDDLANAPVLAAPAHGRLSATAGHDLSFAVTLRNLDAVEREVRLVVEGDAAQGQADPVRIPSNGAVTVFVPVSVSPDAAPGEHRLAARLQDDSGAPVRGASMRLVVLAPADGLQSGQAATFAYTIRAAAPGEPVLHTNDTELEDEPLTRAAAMPGAAAAPEITSRFHGVAEGVIGMQPGESRRLVLDAADTFGDLTFEAPREDEIELVTEIPSQERSQPRAEFDAVLREAGLDPATVEEGDSFTRHDERTGNDVRYEVTNLSANGARFRFAPEVGDRYTLFLAWPNASVVESVDAGVVTFRTEPGPVGEAFTWYDQWPGAAEVVRANDTHVVVRHSPAVGTQHEEPARDPRQGPTRYVVREVRDDAIVIAYSQDPLAGRDLVVDVRLVETRGG